MTKPKAAKTIEKARTLPPIEEGRIRIAVAKVENTPYSGRYVSYFLDASPLVSVPERQFLQAISKMIGGEKDIVICRTTEPTLEVQK